MHLNGLISWNGIYEKELEKERERERERETGDRRKLDKCKRF